MQQPRYVCIHRTVSTDDKGQKGAPAGCIDGTFDAEAQKAKVAGNCAGTFSARPECTRFIPSPETAVGARWWRRHKTAEEKHLAFPAPPPLAASEGGYAATPFASGRSIVAEVTKRVFSEFGIEV
ncbi:MAG: hypothetical protein PHV13_05770 [Candidatus ainarchaeum sp.]|nr:hypothetical protein [Candidatus ainarchaeum sp.]